MAQSGSGKPGAGTSGKGKSGKKVANSLVAISSAAVLAVYAAGYERTKAAADRLEARPAGRHPAAPGPPREQARAEELHPVAPAETTPLPAASGKQDPIASLAPVVTPTQGPIPTESQPVAPLPPVVVVEHPADVPVAPPVTASPAPSAAAVPAMTPVAPRWRDGKYEGWGSCRHGDIQALVVIEGGRIVSATIEQCLTRYSCDVIDKLIPQVAQRQSPDVDSISGATQSGDAFYGAVSDALSKAAPGKAK